MSSNAAPNFIRLIVRISDRELADRVLAEADAAGASGAEQRRDEGTLVLVLYAQAARVARSNAERNGLATRLCVFSGSIDALGTAVFDVVVATLLSTQLIPILPAIAAATRPGGFAILTGLLDAERGEVEACARQAGPDPSAWRRRTDASGDRWLGLVMRRPGGRANR